ncbi:MAG: TlpA disulfide reductase family protein, partial [Bacteroidota bacterium]
MPYNEKLLARGSKLYTMNLKLITQLIHKDLSKSAESIEASQMPIFMQDHIKNNKYPKTIEQFLIADNIDFHLRRSGLTPEIDSLYAEFRENSNPQILQSIAPLHEKWSTLRAGQPAPFIYGITTNGKAFSTKDLRGKIVYVDLWATWCVPCIQEFPYLSEIEEAFQNNDEIEFLAVSIDKDEDKWRAFLTNRPVPGFQVLSQDHEQQSPIGEAYQVYGIPRYLLIDRQGKIIDAMAPRPSSGKLRDAITKLL